MFQSHKMIKCIFAILFSLSLYATTPSDSEYSKLTTLLPEYDFGYYANRIPIEALFKHNDIQIVIEVGSWLGGGSTKHFAKLVQPKNGKVYAVDTWLGSSTQQAGQIHYQPILPYAYEQFLSNMIHWKLDTTVIPCRMTSLEASQVLDVVPDLIYIDAEHTYVSVYQDLTAWYPFVKNKGILCGDDWMWPEVRRAVVQFANENNLKIKSSGNFWLYQKVL